MKNMKIEEFLKELSSKEPVPGGGGASALSGALGAALGNMVGSLTVGKKKYAQAEAEIREEMKKAAVMQKELLELMNKDAEAFLPLSKAYGLPKKTEEELKYRNEVLEDTLKGASLIPLQIMQKAYEALDMVCVMAEKGSRLAVSDAGAAAQFCRTAILGASVNVFINTKLMKNRKTAEELNGQADKLIEMGTKKADEIFDSVMKAIR